MAVAGTFFQEPAAQDRARPTGGAATAAQEGGGLQSVGGRVCHHTAQAGRLCAPGSDDGRVWGEGKYEV